MPFLLDTNVVSEPARPHPDPRVVTWIEGARTQGVAVSAITVGEIQKGISRLRQGRRHQELSRWLETEIPEQFGADMIGIDVPIAREWGRIAAKAHEQGRGLSVVDGLLLATAIIHRLVLVTRNDRDFRWYGVDVLNPWDAP